jgi:hypothetical protein
VFIAPYKLGLYNELRFVLKGLVVFGADFGLILSFILEDVRNRTAGGWGGVC